MVQLINDDYEEFISLGTGLRGEEERLIRLGKPLGQLGEEIEGVRGMLLEQQIIVQEKLDKRAELREEKVRRRPSGRRTDEDEGTDDRHYWIFSNACSTLWVEQRHYWPTQRKRTEQSWSIG